MTTVTEAETGRTRRADAPAVRGVPPAYAVAYLVAMGVAATLEATGNAAWAVTVQAAVALALCLPGSDGRAAGRDPLLAVLVGLSTVRIVVLALPLPTEALSTRTAVAGAGAWIVILLIRRALAQPMFTVARRRGNGADVQLLVLCCGVPAGIAANLIINPVPPNPGDTKGAVITALVLVALSAVPEEVLFRGLLAPASRASFGRLSVLFDGLVYGMWYAGTRDLGFILFAAVIGAGASAVRLAHGRVWALVTAHAVASVLALVIIPTITG